MALRLNALWLARVNHLLIPATKDGRDRIRRSRWGNLLSFLWVLYESLTPLGQLLFLASVLSVGMSLDVFETSTHLLWAALSALWLVSLVLGRRAAALRLAPHAWTTDLREEMLACFPFHDVQCLFQGRHWFTWANRANARTPSARSSASRRRAPARPDR